jgi:hypothetical protein
MTGLEILAAFRFLDQLVQFMNREDQRDYGAAVAILSNPRSPQSEVNWAAKKLRSISDRTSRQGGTRTQRRQWR